MNSASDISKAIARFQKAVELLDDARMVGAPPDCVAERERDLAAARVGLIELGVEPESVELPGDSASTG